MKIATAQTVVSADLAANGAEIRAMVARAADAGAGLISFCEGALSGYAKSQIARPADWAIFDWAAQETELRAIAELCRTRRIAAIVGAAHRLSGAHPPHNSLYVIAATGALLTRYDKRFLSNTELSGWYTPGTAPITFEIEGYRFGCAICIEVQFPEIFAEYERLGVDAVLFASYGIPSPFQIALQAHAGTNCFWIGAATPAQRAPKGPAGILGPEGDWIERCAPSSEPGLALAALDRNNPAYAIPLQKARSWRARARQGEIYRVQSVTDDRSVNRTAF